MPQEGIVERKSEIPAWKSGLSQVRWALALLLLNLLLLGLDLISLAGLARRMR
jgi:hypothetical protein